MKYIVECEQCLADIDERTAWYVEIDGEGYYFCDVCWEETQDENDYDYVEQPLL